MGLCLCGAAEVIISGGRRDFLVPVVAPRGAVPPQGLPVGQFQFTTLYPHPHPNHHPSPPPPLRCPLSPTRLLFPLKLHSVSFLCAFEEAPLRSASLPPPTTPPSSGSGETRESLVKVSSRVYSTGGETGLKGALFAFAAVDQESLSGRAPAEVFSSRSSRLVAPRVLCPCSEAREEPSGQEKVDSSFAVFAQ